MAEGHRPRDGRPRHRRASGICTLGAALAIAGCSFAPHYAPPEQPAPVAFREQGEWTQATPADELPKGSWWRVYEDATLDALEGRIESQNPSLAAAIARYDESRAFLDEARSGLLPTLTAGAHATRNRQSNNRPLRSANQPDLYDDRLLGASVGYELDLWGRVRNAVATERALSQAQRALVESARLSLEASLASDYFHLRDLDTQKKLLEDSIDIYTRSFKVAQARHDQGVASGLDVAQAQTQLEDARSTLIDIRSTRSLLEHAIATLAGESASTFTLAPQTLADRLPNVPAGMPSTLLERRPDVAAAERSMAAANSAIGVARAAWFPTLSLSALAGFQDTASSALVQSPNTYWTIGPQAVFTLLDAGRRRAENALAQAKYRETVADYRARVLQAITDVEDNLALLNDLADEARAKDAAVEASGRARDLAWALYQLGAASYTDVAVAQNTSLQAQLAASSVHTRRFVTSVHLVQAIGGTWSVADSGAPEP